MLVHSFIHIALAAANTAANTATNTADHPVLAPIGNSTTSAGDFKDTLVTIGSTVIDYLFFIAGILAVIYIIFAGFQYITAGGSADKTKAARAGIINAVIGLVIIICSFLIVRLGVAGGRILEKSDNPTTSSITRSSEAV